MDKKKYFFMIDSLKVIKAIKYIHNNLKIIKYV